MPQATAAQSGSIADAPRGVVAASFNVVVDHVSPNPMVPADPGKENIVRGMQKELHEKFAQVTAENKRAAIRSVTGMQQSEKTSDFADAALEIGTAYFQTKGGAIALAATAVEGLGIVYEVWKDRQSSRRGKAKALVENADISVPKSLREKAALQFNPPQKIDLEPKPDTAPGEEAALKKILVAEASDPNLQSLFGAKREILTRMNAYEVRRRILPPGMDSLVDTYDVDDVHSNPELEDEYRFQNPVPAIHPAPGFLM